MGGGSAGASPAAEQALHLVVDAEPDRVALVRKTVDAWLAAVGWPVRATDALVFAIAEAVSNSIEHAYPVLPAGRVSVDVEIEPAGPGRDRARAVVTDSGHWRRVRPETHRGNGLGLIRAVAESVDIRTGARRTRLTMRTGAVAVTAGPGRRA